MNFGLRLASITSLAMATAVAGVVTAPTSSAVDFTINCSQTTSQTSQQPTVSVGSTYTVTNSAGTCTSINRGYGAATDTISFSPATNITAGAQVTFTFLKPTTPWAAVTFLNGTNYAQSFYFQITGSVVTYDGNGNTGGSVPSEEVGANPNTFIVASNTGSLTKTGYTFADWNTAADGTGTPYAAGSTYTFGNTNVSLYAQWAGNSYTVTLDPGSGTVSPASVTPTFGSSVSLPTPVRSGYTFTGWTTNSDGSGDSYPAGASTWNTDLGASGSTGNLYAQWTAGTISVTYDGNGNTGGTVPTAGGGNTGSTFTVAANTGNLTKAGYTFAGWNTQANGDGTNYAAGTGTFTLASNVTLYATWTANPPDPGPPSGSSSEQTHSGPALPQTPDDPLPIESLLVSEVNSYTATENGRIVPVVVEPTDMQNGWEVVGSDFALEVSAKVSDGDVLSLTSDRGLWSYQGGNLTVEGSGYRAGSIIRAFLIPRNITRTTSTSNASTSLLYLGEATIAPDGTFDDDFLVSPDATAGEYVLQLNGVTETVVRSVNMDMRLVAVRPEFRQSAGFFLSVSDDLSAKGEAKLKTLVEAIPTDAQNVTVMVTGASVSLGTGPTNRKLAIRRTQALMAALQDAGLAARYVDSFVWKAGASGSRRSGDGPVPPLTDNSGKPLSTVAVSYLDLRAP